MKYAGLAAGSQCYCSNTTPDASKIIADMACYYPCTGNKALKCGSNLYYSVYEAPGQFVFPFSLSVSEVSAVFTPVRISVTPSYESADVWLNFGDGKVMNIEGAPYYDYVFTTIGEHEVLTKFVFVFTALMDPTNGAY